MTVATKFNRWWMFALASAFFFFITAATFSSLGVVLPYMIEEFSWSWSQAGTGFSLLALLVGLAGTVPAWTIRRFGIKATYVIGAATMACGFVLISTGNGLYQYWLGASLLGLGFALCATVPGIHLINDWLPDRRSFAIGLYMDPGRAGRRGRSPCRHLHCQQYGFLAHTLVVHDRSSPDPHGACNPRS